MIAKTFGPDRHKSFRLERGAEALGFGTAG